MSAFHLECQKGLTQSYFCPYLKRATRHCGVTQKLRPSSPSNLASKFRALSSGSSIKPKVQWGDPRYLTDNEDDFPEPGSDEYVSDSTPEKKMKGKGKGKGDDKRRMA
jgi:hypothetical protein